MGARIAIVRALGLMTIAGPACALDPVTGLYPKDLDLARASALQFVNRKVGMDPKPG